jgi:hypothetical protein
VVEQAGAGEQLSYSWYFDDGGSAEGENATHAFSKPGSYDVVVGVTSDGTETGASAVVTIQVGAPLGGPDRKGGGTNHAVNAPDHGAAQGPSSGEPGSSAPDSIEDRVGRAPADTQRGRRPRVRRGMTDPVPAKMGPENPAGELVEGELVSAEASLPPEREKQAAARTGKLDGVGGSGGVPGAVWGILATLGLLSAGAVAEAGGAGGIRFWRGRIS